MILGRKRRVRGAASIVACLAVLVGIVIVDTAPRAADAPPAVVVAPAPPLRPARPYWIELTGEQRKALAPLSEDWERLDVQTKRKWVEIGNRYPKMAPDEQVRTQQRMREWALLTPEQRRIARDSFARVRAMNPEQRADMLRKYHALPAEKRQALTTEGRANKVIVVPKQSPVRVSRRLEIREGAKVRNPALAAQKSTNPVVTPQKTGSRAVDTAPAPVTGAALVTSPATSPAADATPPGAPAMATPVKPVTP